MFSGPIPASAPQFNPSEHSPKSLTSCEDVDVGAEEKADDSGAASVSSSVNTELQNFLQTDRHTYPEGGLRAWLVVLGAFSSMLAAFWIINSLGVFQAYLSTHQLASYDEGTIGWIFSVYTFLAFFCGVQIGPIFDAKGPHLLILSGSILQLLSVFLLGICTEYWHFMLTFGVLGGVGSSLLFTPAVSAIGHFFMEKRGAATGLALVGGSFGGVVFPLMLQSIFPRVGFDWATRILGFVLIFLCALANLLIRSRLPPKEGGSILPDFRILRKAAFSWVVVGLFLLELGHFIPITYLVAYALASGAFGSTFSYQLMAIFNAGSCFGRYLPAIFADKIGRFNTMIVTLSLCAATSLGLWLPTTLLPGSSKAVMPLIIIFSFFFGFASGSNLSLIPVCIGQLCDTQEYGQYYATGYSVGSFATLTGIPIAGAILRVCGGNYYGMAVFTGGCYVASTVAFIVARALMVGSVLKLVKV